MANEKITVVGTNIQEKATVIWNVANHLFGYFKPHEYGLVILPMTVLKRFDDALAPTKEKVLETYKNSIYTELYPNREPDIRYIPKIVPGFLTFRAK